jgi:hypothetical protein
MRCYLDYHVVAYEAELLILIRGMSTRLNVIKLPDAKWVVARLLLVLLNSVMVIVVASDQLVCSLHLKSLF